MLKIRIGDDQVQIGDRFAVSFHRTLRLPDDGRIYPLPPTLGKFPVLQVKDYQNRLPQSWLRRGGVFIPMYQREAMWLAFEGVDWKPNAVKIALGGVNALTGESWSEGLSDEPQDYIVCPQQPWLDGINAGNDMVRQFVAMPLGLGYSVEAQLTGQETIGGLHIQVFEPYPGIFPDQPPPLPPLPDFGPQGALFLQATPAMEMGVGAGGRMRQKIYPDSFGLRVWDQNRYGSLFVHILNSAQFQQVTGRPPPPTPVDAAAYTRAGLPWFDLYDEHLPDLAPSEKLAGVKSIAAVDKQRGETSGETGFEIEQQQVRKIKQKRRIDAQDNET